MFASLLETLDSTIVNVALPTIEGNIGASIDEGIWIITGYIISNVVAIPLNPLLTRLLGRRFYFTMCIGGFTFASLLCATAHNLDALVLYRVLQGAFGGGLIATSQIVMRETLPPQMLGLSSALFAMALILGPALGPVAGGYLTDNFSWPWIFTVNVVPGTIAAVVIGALLRNPAPPQRVRIDWTSIGMLALGLGALQFVLDNGERRDWFSDTGIALAATTSATSLIAFAWRQWVARSPVVDLHVLRFRSVSIGALIALAFGALIITPAVITPLYTSTLLGFTVSESGMLLALRALPIVILTPIFATLAQRGSDVRYMIGAGFVLIGISMVWLFTTMTSNTPFAALAWPLVLSGIAQSMILVPLIVGVLSTTPAELNGTVSPLITLSVQLGASTASAISVAYFDRRTSFHAAILSGAGNLQHLASAGVQPTHDALVQLARLVTQEAMTQGFADTILTIAAIAAIAAPLVLAFPRSKGALDGSQGMLHE
jgi:MFS transporter, DHA2 family, multidrug resistance protein